MADLPPARRSKLGAVWRPLIYLAPAICLLSVWIVYPIVYTIVRSLLDVTGHRFVGLSNYVTALRDPEVVHALKNNVIWVAFAPITSTTLGLVLAVVSQRLSWGRLFRTLVFLPLAISFFSIGVIWQLMDAQDPRFGTVNAAINQAVKRVAPTGALAGALPSTTRIESVGGGFRAREPVRAGSVVLFGVNGFPVSSLPANSRQAVLPKPAANQICAVVWRDFSPNGPVGNVVAGERGVPGVDVDLIGRTGSSTASGETAADGVICMHVRPNQQFRAQIPASALRGPWQGIAWLGDSLITVAMLVAFIWFDTGFALVVATAGLTSLPEDVQDAARCDGATELQIFWHVTLPLMRPILAVIFIATTIDSLKVFDLVLSLAPAASQPSAATLAYEIYRIGFTGGTDFGVASSIAVLLLILVTPFVVLNVRRARRAAV